MAGTKETPRQRMIGMMYLVLTALLALNVSKDIINAFVKLDQKLLDNQKAILSKSESVLADLEEKKVVPEQRKIVEPYYRFAMQVRKEARKAEDFILACKNQLIQEVEGTSWLVDDPERKGRKTFRSLMEVETKDDYDAATRLFGGDEGSSGYRKGAEIRDNIHRFRNWLCEHLAERTDNGKKYSFRANGIPDPLVSDPKSASYKKFVATLDKALKTVKVEERKRIREIFLTLTLPRQIEDYEETVAWQLGMFDHAPVVAAAAMFTSFQNDILGAEAMALDLIGQRVNVPPFHFNTIKPMAFAPSAFLNLGDSMNISVLTAAYDSNEISRIRWSEVSAEDAYGKPETGNEIHLRANTPGQHMIHGYVGVKQAGDLVWKPWSFKYEVGKPSAFASPLDMNVLYAGVVNRIGAIASGFPNERVSLSAPGCTVSNKGNGEYEVMPAGSAIGRNIVLTVSGRDENGASKTLGTTQYRVRPVPNPIVYLGSVSAVDGRISRSALLGARNILAAFDPSVTIAGKFEVRTCEISVRLPNGNKLPGRVIRNGELDPGIKAIFQQCAPGSVVEIRNLMVYGPGNRQYKVIAPSFVVY